MWTVMWNSYKGVLMYLNECIGAHVYGFMLK